MATSMNMYDSFKLCMELLNRPMFNESARQFSQGSINEPLASDMCRCETKTLKNCMITSPKDAIMPIHHRSFFYGICHACYEYAGRLNSPLKRCSRCQLVYYCSSNCQKKDWPSHKDLCKINAIKPDGKNIFFGAKEVLNDDEWSQYVFYIINYNKSALKRNLQPFEEDIFCFPRLCFVCKESNPELLTDCKDCYSVSYCSKEHKQMDKKYHKLFCDSLNMALECYVYKKENGYISCSLPIGIKDVFKSLQNEIIIDKIPKKDANGDKMDECFRYIMSEVITYPLSIIYALEKVTVKLGKQKQPISEVKELTVHLVGSVCHTEMLGIKKWEYFMHQLPALTNLRILFVGPNFWGPGHKNYRHEDKLRGCEDCQQKGRQVLYEESVMLYHEYVRTEYYKKPDVICVFNCGFHCEAGNVCDTWPESLIEMTKYHDVPLIFTSYNSYEAEKDLLAVQHANQVEILLDVSHNPYASVLPIRSLPVRSYILCYDNLFITVVRGKE